MKQLVLEKIVVSGFPPVNKRCLWLKGNTFYFWYKGAWRSVDSNVDITEEFIEEKVSESVATEAVKIVGDAPEEYDTLGEIAQSTVEHQENIKANTEAIKELEQKISAGGGVSEGWEAFD